MIATTAAAAGRPVQPYPGLRPFEAHEWSIFFGRERMIDDVIERLATNRLVLIHGASGSGKSSLVRAGVMPKLARQHQRHGTPWLTCAMRPSGGPLWNLASQFARLEGRADDVERIGVIVGLFNRRGTTLASVASSIEGMGGESLCILVDQFEELFRFEKETSREEAELFVDLLGRATEVEEAINLHVVVTMRSEFLGECARFDGLAEIINRTQYLVPRMDDEALMRAVRRPAQLFKGTVPEALADRLIAQVRGREDELPLLQHGLMLMWDEAAAHPNPNGRIVLDGDMVEQAGGLAELLSAHADRVMDSVAPDAARAKVVEALFRELTDVNAEGSAIRRPRSFGDLTAAIGASAEELRFILDAFRAPGASFLTPYAPTVIAERSIIDVSHEALIRCWRRIASGKDSWLKREFDDGLAWRSLLAEAEAFEKNRARVLSAAATEDRGSLFVSRNEVWSRRYGGGWPRVGQLLEASRKAAARSQRNTRVALALLATLFVGALALAYGTTLEWQQAEAEKKVLGQRNEESNMLFEHITNINTSRIEGKIADQELFDKMKLLSDRGNAIAVDTLGLLYYNGIGTNKDFAKAFDSFRKSAELGNTAANRHVGTMYAMGLSVSQDYIKAREWYEKGAIVGDARAMLDIGLLYDNGQGVQQDYVKAREWYEKAATAGDTTALLYIGSIFFNGQGIPQDYAKAREWYEKAATAGDAAAMSTLGLLYDNGQGVPLDYAKAREWYEKAAAAGEATALRYIGNLYSDGHGVPQNYVKAREWYEKAATTGDATAMTSLGLLYNNGQGIPQDYVKAREWYEKAATAGDATAMNNLALIYYKGQGISQDYAKAREWYEKAATAGDATALRYIGNLFLNGQGIPQNYVKAREWYEKAAAAADAIAMQELGNMYDAAEGVPADHAKALDWYEKAAAAGDNDAFVSVSWEALLIHDFQRSLAASERAHHFDPQTLSTDTNRAHALMFLGRTEEARALYLSHLDQPVPDSDNKPWQQVVEEDFVALRKAGLDNPLMKEIEAAFAAHQK